MAAKFQTVSEGEQRWKAKTRRNLWYWTELEIAVWTQAFQSMVLDTGVNTCVWINKEHAEHRYLYF